MSPHKKPAVSGGVKLGSRSLKAPSRWSSNGAQVWVTRRRPVLNRRSVANADAADVNASVAVFNPLPFGMAGAVDRLIGPYVITRLVLAGTAVIAAIDLRADDRTGGQASDDTGGDRAAVTGLRGLRCDGGGQSQSGDDRGSNDFRHGMILFKQGGV